MQKLVKLFKQSNLQPTVCNYSPNSSPIHSVMQNVVDAPHVRVTYCSYTNIILNVFIQTNSVVSLTATHKKSLTKFLQLLQSQLSIHHVCLNCYSNIVTSSSVLQQLQ